MFEIKLPNACIISNMFVILQRIKDINSGQIYKMPSRLKNIKD